MDQEVWKTKDGETAMMAEDGDQTWFAPSKNPFLQGCCECGAVHRVEYCIEEGKLLLRYINDQEETLRLKQFHAKHSIGMAPLEAQLQRSYGIIDDLEHTGKTLQARCRELGGKAVAQIVEAAIQNPGPFTGLLEHSTQRFCPFDIPENS